MSMVQWGQLRAALRWRERIVVARALRRARREAGAKRLEKEWNTEAFEFGFLLCQPAIAELFEAA
jgi:hypothetical protein